MVSILKVIEKSYDGNFERGPSSKVQFEENEIKLKIPESIICDGWSMTKLNPSMVYTNMLYQIHVTTSTCIFCHIGEAVLIFFVHTQVCREDVENYTPCKVLVPCQVMVHWVGGEKPQKPLSYKIRLLGAKKECDFLTVTSPTLCIGMCKLLLPIYSLYSLTLPQLTANWFSHSYFSWFFTQIQLEHIQVLLHQHQVKLPYNIHTQSYCSRKTVSYHDEVIHITNYSVTVQFSLSAFQFWV